jgi:hypothetical protein
VKMEERKGSWKRPVSRVGPLAVIDEDGFVGLDAYLRSLAGISWANQLTLTTFSYSSSDWICIGM